MKSKNHTIHTHKNNKLFVLIKSLTKGEKRNFKLFTNRLFRDKSNNSLKFVQLFKAIDRMKIYDEKAILKKVEAISPSQLPNLKVFLYNQILESLRLIHTDNDISLKIREQIDFAKILYNKGLYSQSIKLLNKSKKIANQHNQYLLIQDILEFRKLIERQHITKDIDRKISQMTNETARAAETIKNTVSFSNLSLQLYALYLKTGYVKNSQEKKWMDNFFSTQIAKLDTTNLSFFEELYLNQSYIWYNLMLQDFSTCYRYGQKQLNLFHSHRFMIMWQPDLYIQSISNVLSSLYFSRHYTRFCKTLEILLKIRDKEQFKSNFNISTLVKIFCHTHTLNKHFLEGSFHEGVKYIPQVEEFLEVHMPYLDNHRILIFYYKIASMYFGNDDFRNAIRYLNRVINLKQSSLRNDLHCFARILNLISHYEVGNHELLEYQIRSTYRFLLKIKDLQEVQKYVLKFLRKTSYFSLQEVYDIFRQCREDLLKWQNDPYEKRAFLYLDFISWLDAKIENRPLAKVMQEKALRENK